MPALKVALKESDLEQKRLNTLINNMAESMLVLNAESKGLSIVATVDNDTAPVIISSQLYVREILQNFVTNVLKYSDQGTITIRASAAVDGIKFNTSDQGKVFYKFFRTEDFRTRSTSGTGLGFVHRTQAGQARPRDNRFGERGRPRFDIQPDRARPARPQTRETTY